MQATEQTTATQTEQMTPFQRGIEAVRLKHVAKTQRQIDRQSQHNEDLRQAVNAEAVPTLSARGKGGEDMGDILSIDSPQTITNHYHGIPVAEQTKPEAKTKPLGRLGKLALVAGLLGAGASIPIGLSLLQGVLTRPQVVVVPTEPKPTEPAPGPTKTPDSRKYFLNLGE